MQFIKKILIISLFLFFTNFYSQESTTQDEVKAKIEIERIENNIKIFGTAENFTEITKSASYKLSVIRKNILDGNTSNNTQEGIFTLKPNEKIKLSTTQVNITADDEVIVMLIFYNEQKQIISKERLVFNSEKKK